MENRKHQFLIFSILLLIIGFLQYFRKIANGYKLSKSGKILYLATMVTFTISIMLVLYFTNLNNILSFCLGLLVMVLSEHIAKLFLVIGDNFNAITTKIIKEKFDVDLTEELKEKPTENKN